MEMTETKRTGSYGGVKLIDLKIDKPSLIANGTATIDDGDYSFTYNLYDGDIAVSPYRGNGFNKCVKDILRCDILSSIFPLVGKDYISALLALVGESTSFTAGPLCTSHLVSASDVLMQIALMDSTVQVLRTKEGNLAVISPENDHVERLLLHKNGKEPERVNFETFSDAAADLRGAVYITDTKDRDRCIEYANNYEERRRETMKKEDILVFEVDSEYAKRKATDRMTGLGKAFENNRKEQSKNAVKTETRGEDVL